MLFFHLRAGPTIIALHVGGKASGKTIASDLGRTWVMVSHDLALHARHGPIVGLVAWVAEEERPIADWVGTTRGGRASAFRPPRFPCQRVCAEHPLVLSKNIVNMTGGSWRF